MCPFLSRIPSRTPHHIKLSRLALPLAVTFSQTSRVPDDIGSLEACWSGVLWDVRLLGCGMFCSQLVRAWEEDHRGHVPSHHILSHACRYRHDVELGRSVSGPGVSPLARGTLCKGTLSGVHTRGSGWLCGASQHRGPVSCLPLVHVCRHLLMSVWTHTYSPHTLCCDPTRHDLFCCQLWPLGALSGRLPVSLGHAPCSFVS